MKKLVIKTIAYMAVVLLLVFIPAVLIDPYNVFHVNEPRDNGIESNKSFIKTEYIKKHHDDFDALLFGSSRAGFVDIAYLNKVTGNTFYDMASSESLVSEQVTELREIIKSGFVPEKVWVMADDISCFVDPTLHESMLYRVSYPDSITDRVEFYLKYADLITNVKSVSIIRENNEKKADELANGIDSGYDESTHMSYLDRFYNTGTERLDKVSRFDPNEEQYQEGYWVDYYSLRADEAVSDMQDMAELCKEYNIELTVLTNPLYHLTYKKGIENGYLIYLKKLADVTDYYNFSSFNDVTEDYTYYYETSHFMPSVTRMMTDIVCGSDNKQSMAINDENTNANNTDMQNNVAASMYDELKKQGFGVYVTADDVAEVIEMLEDQCSDRGVSNADS